MGNPRIYPGCPLATTTAGTYPAHKIRRMCWNISIYKGSAWVPAFAGTHASGRAGQHFELFDLILGTVKKVTTHNRSLRVQYLR